MEQPIEKRYPKPGDLVRFHVPSIPRYVPATLLAIRIPPERVRFDLRVLGSYSWIYTDFIQFSGADTVVLLERVGISDFKFLHPEHGVLVVFNKTDWDVEVVITP